MLANFPIGYGAVAEVDIPNGWCRLNDTHRRPGLYQPGGAWKPLDDMIEPPPAPRRRLTHLWTFKANE